MKNIKNMSSVKSEWKLSQYTYRLDHHDEVILYNSLTGIVRKFTGPLLLYVQQTLDALPGKFVDSNPLVEDLISAGFIVGDAVNERNRVRMLTEELNTTSLLELTIMPTEQCNFRCVYCYESFARGVMNEDTQRAIVNHVASHGRKLDELRVHWFGGEPLLGWNALVNLSRGLRAWCEDNDVKYMAGMTTNGFLLTPERQTVLLQLGVTRYQISLDGLCENHNRHRIRMGGQGTFDRITNNMARLLERTEKFHLTIRNNVDKDQLPYLEEYINYIFDLAGHDERVSLLLFPVGKWGGPNDEQLKVVEDHRDLWHAMECGRDKGFAIEPLNQLQPGGAVCYAARKNSLVIGADGQLYKCTVALDDTLNKVGTILPNGTLDLDRDKLALWLYSSQEDTTCSQCYFNAACQGAACPLHRMQEHTQPCPDIKIDMELALPLAVKR